MLLITVILLRVLSVLLDPVRLGYTNTVAERYKYVLSLREVEKNTVDVLMMGNSESLVAFSPIDLWQKEGYTSHIAGQPGQSFAEAYYELSDILKRQSPKVLFLETDMFTEHNKLFPSLEAAAQASVNAAFPIIKYHGIWRNIFGVAEPENKHYHGYEQRTGVLAYEGGEYMQPTEERYKMQKAPVFYLDKIRELCSKKGVSLVLLSAPKPVSFNYSIHNTIQDYADKYSLDYIDMNLLADEIGITDDSDYLDGGDHINCYGTEKTTAYIINYLKESYQLTDHRNDAGYEVWNIIED